MTSHGSALAAVVCGLVLSSSAAAFDNNPSLVLDSYEAGRSPAHRLSFDLQAGEPELYRVALRYPPGFAFAGFDALAPRHAPVGAYELDFNFDGTADLSVPLRVLTSGRAYVDTIADSRFTADLEPVLEQGRGTEFHLQLPFGGDARSATLTAPLGARVSLVLFAGLLTNPHEAGRYTVRARLTSVDPDTDGPDDGVGSGPIQETFEAEVAIEPPAHVPFASLRIHEAHLKRRHGATWFHVHGRYRLGGGSDGIDLTTDAVTISFGTFSQTIPASRLVCTRHGCVFHSAGAGITRLRLARDGSFQVHARDVDLSGTDLDRPITFTLQIGNDRGEAQLTCNRHGQCRPRR